MMLFTATGYFENIKFTYNGQEIELFPTERHATGWRQQELRRLGKQLRNAWEFDFLDQLERYSYCVLHERRADDVVASGRRAGQNRWDDSQTFRRNLDLHWHKYFSPFDNHKRRYFDVQDYVQQSWFHYHNPGYNSCLTDEQRRQLPLLPSDLFRRCNAPQASKNK